MIVLIMKKYTGRQEQFNINININKDSKKGGKIGVNVPWTSRLFSS
jgi:hypothetical protein